MQLSNSESSKSFYLNALNHLSKSHLFPRLQNGHITQQPRLHANHIIELIIPKIRHRFRLLDGIPNHTRHGNRLSVHISIRLEKDLPSRSRSHDHVQPNFLSHRSVHSIHDGVFNHDRFVRIIHAFFPRNFVRNLVPLQPLHVAHRPIQSLPLRNQIIRMQKHLKIKRLRSRILHLQRIRHALPTNPDAEPTHAIVLRVLPPLPPPRVHRILQTQFHGDSRAVRVVVEGASLDDLPVIVPQEAVLRVGWVGLAELGEAEGDAPADGFGSVEDGVAGEEEDGGGVGGGGVGCDVGAVGVDGEGGGGGGVGYGDGVFGGRHGSAVGLCVVCCAWKKS
mmetsp:Transcript_11496/g.24583  ORF Transcript_11496/g.24583 Transcript_11496/m.24583 type:complete len:335 (+) Transcript_11496:3-1007(+)